MHFVSIMSRDAPSTSGLIQHNVLVVTLCRMYRVIPLRVVLSVLPSYMFLYDGMLQNTFAYCTRIVKSILDDSFE